MNRRAVLASVALSAARTGCLDSSTTTPTDGPDSDQTYHNPVFEEVFADPTAIRADDAYYAYATFNPWKGRDRRRLVPILRSRDLVNWTYVGEAFESLPDWRDERRLGLWAPDIGRLQGKYVLYYSYARFGDSNPGIGVASSASPAGPFEDHGPLFRSEGVGVPHSIDPCLLRAADAPYLFWGSMRGIYGARLAADGRSLAGEPFAVAGDGVEAAYVIKRNGRYYLFGSRGTCCEGAKSTYHVVVGRSDSLRGPYVNRDGRSLRSAPGTTILHGDDTFVGPGHNAVVRDDAGTDWLLYHAYERANPWKGRTPRRVLLLDRLVWRDGWPTVASGTPSLSAPAPTAATDD